MLPTVESDGRWVAPPDGVLVDQGIGLVGPPSEGPRGRAWSCSAAGSWRGFHRLIAAPVAGRLWCGGCALLVADH